MNNPREINILANVAAILINLILGFKLIQKYGTTKNVLYRESFRMMAKTLFTSMLGAFLFLVLYVLRLSHIIDDTSLQNAARLVVLFFYFFVPSLIYFSLQNIPE